MARPAAIIFDLDGTLYEAPALQEAFHGAFVNFIAARKRVPHHTVEAILTNVKAQIERTEGSTPGELHILLEIGLQPSDWLLYSEEEIEPTQYLNPNPALIATLRKLVSVRKDVATNTSRLLALRALKAIGIAALVDRIWAPEVKEGRIFGFPEAGKPSVELYQRIAESMFLRPRDIVVFGDRQHVDLAPARACGMKAEAVDGVSDLLLRLQTIFGL